MVVVYKLQKNLVRTVIDITDSSPFISTLLTPLLQNILCGAEKNRLQEYNKDKSVNQQYFNS